MPSLSSPASRISALNLENSTTTRRARAVGLSGVLAEQKSWNWFVWSVLILTAVRLWIVFATPLSLGPDEAQYWQWGQTFAWGYYSKPPLIGWAAGLASGIVGDTPFGVRWPAPILHALAAFGVYGFARSAFGARAGLYAGLLYALAPGVMLSSTILSTDALLMPLAAWALFAAQVLRKSMSQGPSRPNVFPWAVCLGVCIGLGALSKYAIGFLVLGLLIGIMLDRLLRAALVSPAGLVALVTAVCVLVPNVIWNAQHEGQTLRHTVSNANLDDLQFSLPGALSWLMSQFGVFGFVAFPVGLWVALMALFKPDHPARAWAGSALVPVLAIAVIAWASRANANWAAIALPALCALTGLAFATATARFPARWLLPSVLVFQAALGGVAYAAIMRPGIADQLGFSNALADVRGWPELSTEVQRAAKDAQATGIIVDTRHLYHGLKFVGQSWIDTPSGLPLRIWHPQSEPDSFAEAVAGVQNPGSQAIEGTWLLVSLRQGFEPYLQEDFPDLAPLREIRIALTPKRDRVVKLYLVRSFRPAVRSVDDLPQTLQRAAQAGL
jgi:4-amino-4-deoxy-L-arabinose transferase-like glycosyltransferase